MFSIKSNLVRYSIFGILCIVVLSCSDQNSPAQPNGDVVVMEKSNTDQSLKLVHPQNWPKINALPLDPAIEEQIDEIMPKLTLEQKVGQIIQADNGSITPEEVKQYRLGSVLSGGNSAPGPLPYADTKT